MASLLRVGLGLAFVAALACFGSPASAQGKGTVYFLSWGGTIQTMLEKEGWAEKFKEDTGYTLTLVPKATSAEIIATAIAQKDKPQVDVVMCDLAAFQQGMAQQIFADLTEQEVPNLAKMVASARLGKGGVATYADILAIAYHTEIFKRNGWAPPTTWKDLFRPELAGKVIVPPASNTYGMYLLVELARENGGGERNIEPGFEALKKLAPSVVDWTTTFAKIADLMQQETAAIAVFGNASGWEIAKRGAPVNVIVPEVSYVSPTVAGVMKNSPNAEGARVFLNWLISEKVLTYRAERFGQSPMNMDVKLAGEAAKRVVAGKALETMRTVDYDYISTVRAQWNEKFQREVAPIR
ncbi:MAG: extracellular solute-binding protein [Hyphomicrobiaceae bacterium]|nr:extracellular solute-binding protein [Hyphomicrobiaceae bacterium]